MLEWTYEVVCVNFIQKGCLVLELVGKWGKSVRLCEVMVPVGEGLMSKLDRKCLCRWKSNVHTRERYTGNRPFCSCLCVFIYDCLWLAVIIFLRGSRWMQSRELGGTIHRNWKCQLRHLFHPLHLEWPAVIWHINYEWTLEPTVFQNFNEYKSKKQSWFHKLYHVSHNHTVKELTLHDNLPDLPLWKTRINEHRALLDDDTLCFPIPKHMTLVIMPWFLSPALHTAATAQEQVLGLSLYTSNVYI